jgi:hypothetical protein
MVIARKNYMVGIEKFEPKGLIEYEERALGRILIYSLFLIDVPAARRVAHQLGDHEMLKLLGMIAPPLLALGAAQDLVEEAAPRLLREVIQFERVTLLIQNLDQKWDIGFDATHRSSTIWIRNISMRQRSWISKLLNEPPTVTIVRRAYNQPTTPQF